MAALFSWMPKRKTTNRHDRVCLMLWAVIMLIPILSWLALITVTLFAQTGSLKTGDALFDWYLGEIAAIHESNHSQASQNWYDDQNTYFGCIPFQENESEFGSDPRFWELRHWDSHQAARNDYDDLQSKSDQIIIQAIEHNAISAPLLLKDLRNHENRGWSQGYKDYSDQDSHHCPNCGADPRQYLKEIRDQIDVQTENKIDACMDKLIAFAPNESMPFYFAANVETERGNYPLALDYISKGNKTKKNSTLFGFPFEFLYRKISEDHSLIEPLAGGWLANQYPVYNANYRNSHKHVVMALLDYSVEEDSLANIDKLHTHVCRLGKIENQSGEFALQSLDFLDLVFAACQSMPTPPSPSQSLALQELKTKIDHLEQEMTTLYNNPTTHSLGIRTELEIISSAFEDYLSGGKRSQYKLYKDGFKQEIAMQSALNGKIFGLYSEIESFDYTILDWE